MTNKADIKRVEEDKDAEIKRLDKIVDRLEQRISSLEKVLASHAKCIGELREEDVKTWETTNPSGDKITWVGIK